VTPASSSGQTAPRKRAAGNAAAADSGTAAPKYKGIWEPMNYPDDVQLRDVFFVNDKVGWIAGKGTGGFILHTADGGQHWEVQMGDPHSDNADVNALRFLDAVHGWAIQGGHLIRTTDGKTWETIGPFANSPTQYRFTSVLDGVEIAGDFRGSTIYVTRDGGHNWKSVFECATTLQVNGLTRNTTCHLRDLYFVSSQVGYAVGGGYDGSWAAITKTVDGGASWKVIFATTDLATASAVFFTDENNGVIRLNDQRVFVTADGGQSWHGGTGSAEASIKFADPQVGWSCNDGYRCSYTLDGGRSWTVRNFNFPTGMAGYSIPRRDRGFVVGDHGMIYRYRIVPTSYLAQGIIDAPLMPAYGGALNDQLDSMSTHCKEIQAKLASASQAMERDGYVPDGRTSSYGHLRLAALMSYEPEPQGFTQDTSSLDSLNAPASPVMQNCCATQLQGLQTSVGSFSQQVPTFSGQFRNLNLLFVGLNMLSDLLNKAHAIQAAFLALKQAPNTQTASTALGNLLGQVDTTNQTLASGFENLTSTNAVAGAVGGAVNNMAGSPAANGAGTTTGGTTAQGTNATAQPQNQGTTTSNAVDQAAQKAKQKLKKVIPF
jgi:photosystem II stability/assembly factor-like uncharacterized protein